VIGITDTLLFKLNKIKKYRMNKQKKQKVFILPDLVEYLARKMSDHITLAAGL